MGGHIKRKVVQHGPSTLIVSLPSKWIKECGIKKGDEVEIEENGRTLVVGAEKTKTDLSFSIDVSGLKPRLVDRLMARSYQKGYDKITLAHHDLKLLEVIRKKVSELIGFEIIEQNNKFVVVQSIASSIELDFDQSLRKIFLILQDMLQNCHEAYNQGDDDALSNLELQDLEVNRMAYFCLRQLTKDQAIDAEQRQQRMVLYYLIENLEDLGDCYKKMAKKLAQTKKKNSTIVNLLKKVIDQFALSHSYFYAPTKKKANDAFELNDNVRDLISEAVSKKMTPEEIISAYYLKEATHIIYHITTMRLDTIEKK